MNTNQKTFSIGDASKFTGVTARQLRNWEDLGFLGKVERIVCGERAYRRYTQSQVSLIEKIREHLKEGYTLKMAAQKAREYLGVKGVV
jgi:DNA-binding transcriptional MerR regulator